MSQAGLNPHEPGSARVSLLFFPCIALPFTIMVPPC